jgi:hypothetical protein
MVLSEISRLNPYHYGGWHEGRRCIRICGREIERLTHGRLPSATVNYNVHTLKKKGILVEAYREKVGFIDFVYYFIDGPTLKELSGGTMNFDKRTNKISHREVGKGIANPSQTCPANAPNSSGASIYKKEKKKENSSSSLRESVSDGGNEMAAARRKLDEEAEIRTEVRRKLGLEEAVPYSYVPTEKEWLQKMTRSYMRKHHRTVENPPKVDPPLAPAAEPVAVDVRSGSCGDKMIIPADCQENQEVTARESAPNLVNRALNAWTARGVQNGQGIYDDRGCAAAGAISPESAADDDGTAGQQPGSGADDSGVADTSGVRDVRRDGDAPLCGLPPADPQPGAPENNGNHRGISPVDRPESYCGGMSAREGAGDRTDSGDDAALPAPHDTVTDSEPLLCGKSAVISPSGGGESTENVISSARVEEIGEKNGRNSGERENFLENRAKYFYPPPPRQHVHEPGVKTAGLQRTHQRQRAEKAAENAAAAESRLQRLRGNSGNFSTILRNLLLRLQE